MRDDLFQTRRPQLVDFVFDDDVAEVFPDMIRRSVPGYELVVPMTGLMAARHLRRARSTPLAYDLGCSLGATSRALLSQLGDSAVRIVAVDNAPAMVTRARQHNDDPRLVFVEGDIRHFDFEPCGVMMANYVLQFVPLAERLALLRRMHEALAPGGIALVAEKIRFEDRETEAEFDAAHLDFKRANGYSELEISAKRSALENVMILDSEEHHRQRFAAAGFRRVECWFRCLNWASFVLEA